MRILVCGDRRYTRYSAILSELHKYDPATTVVIHGCARGADTLAGVAAKALGMTVLEFPARWDQYGRAAGLIRNTQMLAEGRPDLIIAFHDSIETSRGTKNMMTQGEAANIEVRLIEHS